MMRTHSDDPDVAAAADEAAGIIEQILRGLPKAESFDYGGHQLRLGEYGVCTRCTASIAEAQAAEQALRRAAADLTDPEVKEHLEIAADLFRVEADAAKIRAELHNGQNSEHILNMLLGFIYERGIHDSYDHSHNGGGTT